LERKTTDEISRLREAGRIVRAVLDEVAAAAQPGTRTAELDRLAG
jgi:methionyl aminopeptidase